MIKLIDTNAPLAARREIMLQRSEIFGDIGCIPLWYL